LRPAQLRCWSALESFRGGDYNDSAEAFYNALLEDPDSQVIKVLLAESLFAIGEYRYAAKYLREGLGDWEEFPGYQWSPAALYGKAEDFPARLKLLEDEALAHPENEDLQVVLGYERFVHGKPDAAKGVFGALATSSSDAPTRKLSARFLKRIESVAAAEGKQAEPVPETPTSRFLKSLSLEDLRSLEMR
jgi:thioredoxin-like negative regulator of GroEL